MTPVVQQFLAVALGGAVGAGGRYLVMVGFGHWFGHGFPWGTMVVNVVGSFILGAFIETSALVWSPSPELRSFIAIGILGAFTTFSAFSLDAYSLWMRGEALGAFAYVAASLILGIGALFAGLWCFRIILS